MTSITNANNTNQSASFQTLTVDRVFTSPGRTSLSSVHIPGGQSGQVLTHGGPQAPAHWGPGGADGPTGPTGPTGPAGPDGATGAAGLASSGPCVAAVGVGGDYATVEEAMADGEFNICMISDTTELAQLTATSDLCVHIDAGVTWSLFAATPSIVSSQSIAINGCCALPGLAPSSLVVPLALNEAAGVCLSNLTVSSGGAALLVNGGSLTISRCRLEPGFGLVVSITALLGNSTITHCTITGNCVPRCDFGVTNLTHSTFQGLMNIRTSTTVGGHSITDNSIFGGLTFTTDFTGVFSRNEVLNFSTSIRGSDFVFNNNKIVGPFTGYAFCTNFTMTGNQFHDLVDFNTAVATSLFSGNQFRAGLNFNNGCTSVDITGNVVSVNDIKFQNSFIPRDVTITGNVCNGGSGIDFQGDVGTCTVSGNSTDGAISVSGTSEDTNTVTGNHAVGGFAGWTDSVVGYPNDLLDTGIAPVVVGVGLNRV